MIEFMIQVCIEVRTIYSSQHESTWVNMSQHESTESTTRRVNMSQHESTWVNIINYPQSCCTYCISLTSFLSTRTRWNQLPLSTYACTRAYACACACACACVCPFPRLSGSWSTVKKIIDRQIETRKIEHRKHKKSVLQKIKIISAVKTAWAPCGRPLFAYLYKTKREGHPLFVIQDHHESLNQSDEALLTWVVGKAEDL